MGASTPGGGASALVSIIQDIAPLHLGSLKGNQHLLPGLALKVALAHQALSYLITHSTGH